MYKVFSFFAKKTFASSFLNEMNFELFNLSGKTIFIISAQPG